MALLPAAGAALLTVFVLLPLSYLLLLLAVNKPASPQRHGGASGHGRRQRLPPSPPGLPLLGHLHLLGSLPHRALQSLARAHGPVMLLLLGRVPTVVVSSAAGAEEVMRARDLASASRPRSAMAERLMYGRDVAFAPYGDYWRQARRVCVVHLLSARRTRSFRRVREQEAAALVERVRAKAGAAVGLTELLAEYANTVVCRAAFGDESARGLFDGGDRARERIWEVLTGDFQKLMGTEPLGELLPWLGWVDAVRGLEGKITRTFQALDGLLEKVIDDHRRRPPNTDDDDHRDFVDHLGHRPGPRGVGGRRGVRAGEVLGQRRRGLKGQHMELVPFGAGRRGCPGVGFAEASVEVALASLLYHFDWEAAEGKGSRAGASSLDMSEMNGLSVHIKSGLPLVAKPWTHPSR